MNDPTLEDALRQRLIELDARTRSISDLTRLTSGASRETWTFTVTDESGDTRDLVLRRDPVGVEDPQRMALESASIIEAAAQSVPVPTLLDHSGRAPDGPLGSAYLLMERVPGEALPQRLLRDNDYDDIRSRLPYEFGRILARIHRMDLAALPGHLAGGDQRDVLFDQYQRTGLHLPILEVAFAWLLANRPEPTRETVVHGDFRNGNLLVDHSGVRAVLDWELVHRGDPMEDLGWLCMKTWRFGSPEPVGGFGSREDLFSGYADESGIAPDPATVHWWEVYATVRWAVMCRIQANRVLDDHEGNAVELLAIGRRVAECEHDLLNQLGLGTVPAPDARTADSDADLFGRPSSVELLGAVGDFVREQFSDADPELRYRGRVTANVLRIVGRELALGDDFRATHRQTLSEIGCADDHDLARGLRAGERSAADPAVAAAIREGVAMRLAVANPRYT
ncbi:phosphotransferase family protein [Gordonia sp. CPCC 206044]|uniref:phosphotransferase family protein n=1 Tax=Gordonia sp. CPCC 206044 TaxID=3140793 RepID=UPI003AF3AD2B